jgi:predicted transcriptional regulator
MGKTVRVTLPDEVGAELVEVARREGTSQSAVLRKALEDYLFLRRFRALRARMMAKAQAQGIYTDEDVFERVS